MEDILSSSHELMTVTTELRKYRLTLVFIVGILGIDTFASSLIVSFLVLSESLNVFQTGFFILWIALFLIGFLLLGYTFRRILTQIKGKMYDPFIWGFTYPLCMGLGYLIAGLLPLPDLAYAVVWLTFLGIGSLIIAITIERRYYMEKQLYTRPFLFIGIAFVGVSIPIVFIVIAFELTIINTTIFSTVVNLLVVSLTTFIAMSHAEQRIVG